MVNPLNIKLNRIVLLTLFLASPFAINAQSLCAISVENRGVGEAIRVNSKEVYYQKISAGTLHYHEMLNKYPLFIKKIKDKNLYKQLSRRKQTYKKGKVYLCFTFFYAKTKKFEYISFDIQSLSVKDGIVYEVAQFFKDFNKERGCSEPYQIYQLKKGENFAKLAQRLNMDEESLVEYNYENEINIGTINKFPQRDWSNTELKEGDFVLLPCIPKIK